MVHILDYCILQEGVAILTIKIDGLLNITWNPKTIFVLDAVLIILGIKGIGHPN